MEDLEPTRPIGEGPEPVERLASEIMRRRSLGEDDRLDEALAGLEPTDRARLARMLDGAALARSLLPRQIGEGVTLSGRFRITKELGAGGMGKVFMAFDERLKRDVAVKVLSAMDVSGLDVGALFIRESEVLAKLKHPGIVPVHEAGNDGDVSYIVMELVLGVSGADLLERIVEQVGAGPVPSKGTAIRDALRMGAPVGGVELIDDESYLRSVAKIFVELARTMEAAHAQGVVHRDLKPGNFMLRGDASPVILDFGLAGRLDQDAGELTRRLFGSACYLAPEQASRGTAGAEPICDVYALGAMLYEFVTLDRAFTGDELTPVLQAIVSGDFERPRRVNPAIPLDLEAIILKAMETRPKDRLPSAGALREDLEAWLDERPLVHTKTGVVTRVARLSRYALRRHRGLTLTAVALVLGLLIGGLFWGSGPGAPPRPEVRAFASLPGDLAVRYRHEITGVRDGEYLGVEVDLPEPSWLYAMAISGDMEEPAAYVTPTRPQVIGDTAGSGEFGRIRLPAGRHRIVITQVRESEANETEGFEVWLRTDSDPAIEQYIVNAETASTAMGRASRSGLLAAMAFTAGTLGAPRGKLDSDIPAADMARLMAAMKQHDQVTTLDPLYLRAVFPVRR